MGSDGAEDVVEGVGVVGVDEVVGAACVAVGVVGVVEDFDGGEDFEVAEDVVEGVGAWRAVSWRPALRVVVLMA